MLQFRDRPKVTINVKFVSVPLMVLTLECNATHTFGHLSKTTVILFYPVVLKKYNAVLHFSNVVSKKGLQIWSANHFCHQ